MKEEIEKEAAKLAESKYSYWDYPADTIGERAFEDGAEFVLAKFNGISPSTVTEMIEALRDINKNTEDAYIKKRLKHILSKADKELKR